MINQWKNRKALKLIDERYQKETLRFLSRELKQGAKKLDEKADTLHETVFSRIDCLDCANCCKSLPPLINDTDVNRISRALKMKASVFHQQYVRIDEDGDSVIATTPCPFLGADNYCSIYEVRPKACRAYPHTGNLDFSRHLSLHAQNTLFCPAVYHIIEGLKTVAK